MRPLLILISSFLFHEVSSLIFVGKKNKVAYRSLTSLSMKYVKQQQSVAPGAANLSPVRRSLLQNIQCIPVAVIAISSFYGHPSSATADDETLQKKPLTVDQPLYLILRAREATEQEKRLIKSGKFKDVQRANVKLAVRFIVNNYRLSDNFIAAASFLPENKRYEATEVGQSATQVRV
jgi:hypothetical protein